MEKSKENKTVEKSVSNENSKPINKDIQRKIDKLELLKSKEITKRDLINQTIESYDKQIKKLNDYQKEYEKLINQQEELNKKISSQ